MGILLIGCLGSDPSEPKKPVEYSNIDVDPICDDGVICYTYRDGYGGGLSCFDSEELVKKYCSD